MDEPDHRLIDALVADGCVPLLVVGIRMSDARFRLAASVILRETLRRNPEMLNRLVVSLTNQLMALRDKPLDDLGIVF